MEKHGIYQWDEIYPARSDFENDIRDHTLYTVNDEEDHDLIALYVISKECREILLHIEKQIKEMGYQSIRLDVFTENPFAQRLYLHNGYEPRGYANWRKGRFDLMEKRI
jgi:hypothetical protein